MGCGQSTSAPDTKVADGGAQKQKQNIPDKSAMNKQEKTDKTGQAGKKAFGKAANEMSTRRSGSHKLKKDRPNEGGAKETHTGAGAAKDQNGKNQVMPPPSGADTSFGQSYGFTGHGSSNNDSVVPPDTNKPQQKEDKSNKDKLKAKVEGQSKSNKPAPALKTTEPKSTSNKK